MSVLLYASAPLIFSSLGLAIKNKIDLDKLDTVEYKNDTGPGFSLLNKNGELSRIGILSTGQTISQSLNIRNYSKTIDAVITNDTANFQENIFNTVSQAVSQLSEKANLRISIIDDITESASISFGNAIIKNLNVSVRSGVKWTLSASAFENAAGVTIRINSENSSSYNKPEIIMSAYIRSRYLFRDFLNVYISNVNLNISGYNTISYFWDILNINLHNVDTYGNSKLIIRQSVDGPGDASVIINNCKSESMVLSTQNSINFEISLNNFRVENFQLGKLPNPNPDTSNYKVEAKNCRFNTFSCNVDVVDSTISNCVFDFPVSFKNLTNSYMHLCTLNSVTISGLIESKIEDCKFEACYVNNVEGSTITFIKCKHMVYGSFTLSQLQNCKIENEINVTSNFRNSIFQDIICLNLRFQDILPDESGPKSRIERIYTNDITCLGEIKLVLLTDIASKNYFSCTVVTNCIFDSCKCAGFNAANVYNSYFTRISCEDLHITVQISQTTIESSKIHDFKCYDNQYCKFMSTEFSGNFLTYDVNLSVPGVTDDSKFENSFVVECNFTKQTKTIFRSYIFSGNSVSYCRFFDVEFGYNSSIFSSNRLLYNSLDVTIPTFDWNPAVGTTGNNNVLHLNRDFRRMLIAPVGVSSYFSEQY